MYAMLYLFYILNDFLIPTFIILEASEDHSIIHKLPYDFCDQLEINITILGMPLLAKI